MIFLCIVLNLNPNWITMHKKHYEKIKELEQESMCLNNSHNYQESTEVEWSESHRVRGEIAMAEDQGVPPFTFTPEEKEEEPTTYDEILMQQSRNFFHSLQVPTHVCHLILFEIDP